MLHVCCDLTIAADNARFGQTGPRVGSFDGGYGASLLAAQIGQKRAKEVWFLARQYDAHTALQWGLVNAVVPLAHLEDETVRWCREMLAMSPFALRLLKASFNANEDGMAGLQQLAHDANLLFYGSDEAREGREAYKAKRPPTSGSSRSGHEDLAHGRPAADAARGRRAGPGRHRAGRRARRLRPHRLRVRAAGRPVHPGGHEPLERLLRRPPRRRHRGPHRAGPGHGGRPRAAAPGAARHLRHVRAGVLCGAYLVAIAGPELLIIGAASILAGVLYTGGPRPYGYEGLGEVFVFLFFGLVAVTGSYYVQVEEWPWEAFALAVPVGLLASAILVVNNVRDIDTDRRAGKRTLAVRLGRERTRGCTPRWCSARSPSRRCRGWRARCRRGCSSSWRRSRPRSFSCASCARTPTAPR